MKQIIYLLQNNELQELELETVLEVDGRKEITYKLLGTDEGGNDCDVTEDCQEMGYE
tara:strand:+ start:184 stop:354 length:171 start_codon:yes stop_codon:yes gene_type:complete